MDYVSGEVLTINGFHKGYLGFEKERIVETGTESSPKKPVAKGLIIPSMVNAHVHIGDSFIRKRNVKLPKNVEELVAPPNGLKHRLLKEVSEQELLDGMEESVDIMIKSGTKIFYDFREGGILGICQLKAALQFCDISPVILSRPDSLSYNKNEVDILLKNSDGIGLSAISDWDFSEIKKIAKHTKKSNKIFAFHASERTREDIDVVLDLKPDFLVHMVKAHESDLERVKDNDIPIVICPRSNAFYDLKLDIDLMKKMGVNILIGTDNSMLNIPSILDEVKYLRKQSKAFSARDLLYKVTFGARKALNLDCDILGSNSKVEFVVINEKTLDIEYI
jgi:cytosine/adenosine deaminase-related metal-dependent hydrolase